MLLNAYWFCLTCSFWNFDALFQPQQHPARDSHDTFFLQGLLRLHHSNPFCFPVFWTSSLNPVWCFVIWYLFGTSIFLAPSTTKELPEDYVERVKHVHESGGYGSRGYYMHPSLTLSVCPLSCKEEKFLINLLWQIWIWLEKRGSEQKPSPNSHNCCFLQDALLVSTGILGLDFLVQMLLLITITISFLFYFILSNLRLSSFF